VLFEVCYAADEVDHLAAFEVVEQAVDREVTPDRVLVRLPEDVVVGNQQVRVFPFGDRAPRGDQAHRLRTGAQRNLLRDLGLDDLEVLGWVAPVGRHLDDLPPGEQDVRQSEAPTDHTAVAEEVANFVGACARGQVEVLGFATEHQVPHAATHEVGRVAMSVEAANHFRGVLVDEPPRNRVGVDDRLRRVLAEGASIIV
jgi:hypothetical protein